MNRDPHNASNVDVLSEPEAVGELIRRAGPRAGSADYQLDGLKREAVRRWEQVVERRRRRRTRTVTWAALAAAATLGAATVALRLLAPAVPEPIGRVEMVVQELRSGLSSSGSRLVVGDVLAADTSLRTGASGRAALSLENGIGIRLDRDTEVRLASANRLELGRGAVYVDATGASDADFLDVETALGVVRDIGTVYQVRDDDSAVVVEVRQGRVLVRRQGARHEASAGTRMTLSQDGGVETSPVAPDGQEWSWILEASPSFEMEGATLGAFLDWLARETGWFVHFDGGDAARLRATLLHGSLAGTPPDQTLDLVLPSCGLDYRLQDGVLVLVSDPDGVPPVVP